MFCRHRHHKPKPPVPTPTPPPSTLTVAWTNTDPAVSDADVAKWVDGLNVQVADIQALWPHVQECTHVLVPKGQPAPAGAVPAVLKPSLPEAPGALGYHDNDGKGHASIFIATQTSINAGVEVSSVMSHEACELTVDPSCTLTATAPNGDVWALEVGDPVESDSYTVKTPTGAAVTVSDFVGPAFFGVGTSPLDRKGLHIAPFTVAPGGYAIVNGQAVYGFGTPHVTDPDDLPFLVPSAKLANQGASMDVSFLIHLLSHYVTTRDVQHWVVAFLVAFVASLPLLAGPITAHAVLGLIAAAAVVAFRKVFPPDPPTATAPVTPAVPVAA